MNAQELQQLIELGNQARADRDPEKALACYATVFTHDRNSATAFNNYGNVLREVGEPAGAIPFLQRSIQLEPAMSTARFNLAVSLLLLGDYENGWKMYESRWQYEHLNGALPNLPQPRWGGEDIKDKSIFFICEQGLGDGFQFIRFAKTLHDMGAKVLVHADKSCKELFEPLPFISSLTIPGDELPTDFDYWTPSMSVPGILGVTLDKLPSNLAYLFPLKDSANKWLKELGPKNKLRVGFSWSGRTDTWINQHKAVPFTEIVDLISRNPNYDWFNLQVDCTDEETKILEDLGVHNYASELVNFSETAGLMHHMDVILSVDTAVTHLAGALGRPTWLMLNNFATDWRWLLNRDDSPWYQSVRIFRQPKMDDWKSVIDKIHQYLGWFKI